MCRNIVRSECKWARNLQHVNEMFIAAPSLYVNHIPSLCVSLTDPLSQRAKHRQADVDGGETSSPVKRSRK